jgi:hypothetical protein
LKSNPKYQNVKSVVNHGVNSNQCEVISDNLVAKRKGENFKRIKGSTLVKYLQVAESNAQKESIFGLVRDSEDKENMQAQDDVLSQCSGKTGRSVADSTTSAVTYSTEMLGIS